MNEFESLGQIPQRKHESRFEPKKAKCGKLSPIMCPAVARVLSPQRRRVILSVHLLSMDSGTRPRAELPIVMPQLSSLLESQRKTKRPRQMRNLNPKGAPPNLRVHRPDHSRHGSGLGQLLVSRGMAMCEIWQPCGALTFGWLSAHFGFHFAHRGLFPMLPRLFFK